MARKPTYEELEQRIRELEPAEALLKSSEARFRSMVEKSPLGIAIVNDQYQYTDANQEFINIAGYPKSEIIGANFFFLLSEESRKLAIDRYVRRQRGEAVPDRYEVSFIKKNGDRRVGEVQSTVFMDSDGKVNSLLQVYDITDRKLSENALKESEKKYRVLVENSGEAIFVAQDRQLKFINPAVEGLVGYPKDALISHDITEFIHPDDRPMVLERHLKRMKGERSPARYVFRIVTRRGEIRWVELNAVTIDWESRPASLNFMSDITERRQMEEFLRKSEEKFRFLAEKMGDIVWTMDMDLQTTYVSPSVFRLLGFTPEERKQQPLTEQVTPESLSHITVFFQRELDLARSADADPDRSVTIDVEYRHRDGSSVWMENTVKWIRDEQGALAGIYGLSRDITERRRAEAEVRLKSLVLDQITDHVVITDLSGSITYVNQAAGEFSGIPKDRLTDQPLSMLRGDGEEAAMRREIFKKTIREGQWRGEITKRRQSGVPSVLDFRTQVIRDVKGNPVALCGIGTDITEQKKMAEEQERLYGQLVQAQKMDSVGRLAGGVAHDFNNMLGVIIGHAELALRKIPPDHAAIHSIHEIQRSAHRAADLTRQLLAFARKQTISPKRMSLNETVESMSSMLRRLIGEDIHLTWRPGAGLWPVKMDPAQVDQIVINLCVNARDAIHERSDGTGNILIRTENVSLDLAFCKGHPESAAGDYVLLSVTDDGCGMAAEVREKLFEPFFTTKAPGRGTGLGLAMIYGIIRQNSGFINVTTRPGEGTTFDVFMPREKDENPPVYLEIKEKTPTGGNETVLVVEDEPAIQDMVRIMLENLGYRTLSAGSAAEALRLAETHGGRIDLLMTDVIMPECNGRDLAERLSSLYPGIKVLFMSGYTADVIANRGFLDENVHFIQKPFVMRELAASVQKALR